MFLSLKNTQFTKRSYLPRSLTLMYQGISLRKLLPALLWNSLNLLNWSTTRYLNLVCTLGSGSLNTKHPFPKYIHPPVKMTFGIFQEHHSSAKCTSHFSVTGWCQSFNPTYNVSRLPGSVPQLLLLLSIVLGCTIF